MGTRCLTYVEDEQGEKICCLYRQFDGYPEGHGRELLEFLKGAECVNGLGDMTKRQFNGPECLAAQLVAYFKKEPGHFYLFPAESSDLGEEWVYVLKWPDFKASKEVQPFFGEPGERLKKLTKKDTVESSVSA